jgi:hypothetical protein
MADSDQTNSRRGPLGSIVGLGGRAASATLRPVAGAAVYTLKPVAGAAAYTLRPVAGAAAYTLRPVTGAAAAALQAGRGLERRAVDRVLESPELERLPVVALDSPVTQAAIRNALASDGARQLVDAFFESGLLDDVLQRLVASDALWRMVDDIAASPAVRAAIAQQGLGFADQVGEITRSRSRSADDWLERGARRLTLRRPKPRAASTGEAEEVSHGDAADRAAEGIQREAADPAAEGIRGDAAGP